MTTLQNDKYVLIKNAVSEQTCRVLAREFRMARDIAGMVNTGEQYPYKDDLVQKSFSWYSPLCFEALSDSIIRPIVESLVDEPLYPTYSYARVYYPGAEMRKHVDRSSSEYSVTMCVDIDRSNTKWNLGIETLNGENIYIDQDPGDIIVYRGNDLYHWRDPYHGKEQINAFMFYVRANGEKAELKYDTRPMLGMPSTSRRLTSEQQFEKYPVKYS
jgi:hypothetical protein